MKLLIVYPSGVSRYSVFLITAEIFCFAIESMCERSVVSWFKVLRHNLKTLQFWEFLKLKNLGVGNGAKNSECFYTLLLNFMGSGVPVVLSSATTNARL